MGRRYLKTAKQSRRRSVAFRGSQGKGASRSGVHHRSLHCEVLEDRRLLSGVTLITHGFEFTDNPDNLIWLDNMEMQVAARIATTHNETLDQLPQFKMTVANAASPTVTWDFNTANFPGQGDPRLFDLGTSKDGEAVIILDWSAVAGATLETFPNLPSIPPESVTCFRRCM